VREPAAHTHELPDGIRKEFNRVTLDSWIRGYREFRLRVWGAESRVTSIRPEALRAGDASKERVVLPLQARPTHLRAECRVRPSAQVGWAGQTHEAEEGRQSWAVWIATPRCLGDQQAGQFGGLQASPHHRRNHRQLHRGAVRSPVKCPAQAGRIDPGQCAELPHGGLPLPNEAGRRRHLVFRCVPRAPLQRQERRTVRSKLNGLRESDPVRRIQDAVERKRHSRSDDS
jgi:hypothetical protein